MMKRLKFDNNWNKTRKEREADKTLSGKELMIESLKLPKDSMLGASLVTLTGNTEAFVENYKGIIEYTNEVILLQGKTCKIEICGKRLRIIYYTNEDMKINGWIEKVHYFV